MAKLLGGVAPALWQITFHAPLLAVCLSNPHVTNKQTSFIWVSLVIAPWTFLTMGENTFNNYCNNTYEVL